MVESQLVFIDKLVCRESHYGRGKSTRQYLPPELSIGKLYKMWCEERGDRSVSKLTRFVRTFNENYNLGFGSPRVDVCSFCIEMKELERKNDKEARIKLQLHLRRAEKFYSQLREAKNTCDVLCVAFDIQQNQPLPKVSVTEAFYSRQLWIYNAGFVIHEPTQNPKNVFLYTWNEWETGRGSNEVTSALNNLLHRLQTRANKRKYKKLHLFADNCAGQNKNVTLLFTLLRYACSPHNPYNEILITFPERGHSYLPPDRVFGRIEKKLRVKEVIKRPEEYHQVFSTQGRVKVLGRDCYIFDMKTLGEKTLKKSLGFPMRLSKRWLFRKNQQKVEVSASYTGPFQQYDVLKPNITNFVGKKPRLLKLLSHVSAKKEADVRKLLKFVNPTAADLQFYEEILTRPKSTNTKDEGEVVRR